MRASIHPGPIRFLPYAPAHFAGLRIQAAQAYLGRIAADPALAAALAHPRWAWTGECTATGRVLGCAGLIPRWEGSATAWALFADGMPRRAWPAITGHVLGILDDAAACGVWRVEASVLADFAAGRRWAARLGFGEEGYSDLYCPAGRRHVRVARLLPDVFWFATGYGEAV